jgi:hypothetical protein
VAFIYCSLLVICSRECNMSWVPVATWLHPHRHPSNLREPRGRCNFCSNRAPRSLFSTFTDFLTQWGRISWFVVQSAEEVMCGLPFGAVCASRTPCFKHFVRKQSCRWHCSWNANDCSDFATKHVPRAVPSLEGLECSDGMCGCSILSVRLR